MHQGDGDRCVGGGRRSGLPAPRSGARVRRRARGDPRGEGRNRAADHAGRRDRADRQRPVGDGHAGDGADHDGAEVPAVGEARRAAHRRPVLRLLDRRVHRAHRTRGAAGRTDRAGARRRRDRDHHRSRRRAARVGQPRRRARRAAVARGVRRRCWRRDRCIRRSRRTRRCPTTRGCGRRCSARAAARGAAACTTSTASSSCSTRGCGPRPAQQDDGATQDHTRLTGATS